MYQQSISFPEWKQVLAGSSLAPHLKADYLREILSFLKYLKSHRSAATVAVAKQYLPWRERQTGGPAREALRWFYRRGRPSPTANLAASGPPVTLTITEDPPAISPPARLDHPPLAKDDLGSQPWERELIKAIRERNFLWRTEQTYREWAVRFTRFIAPRSPSAASGEEVAEFLSALAVQDVVTGRALLFTFLPNRRSQTRDPQR